MGAGWEELSLASSGVSQRQSLDEVDEWHHQRVGSQGEAGVVGMHYGHGKDGKREACCLSSPACEGSCFSTPVAFLRGLPCQSRTCCRTISCTETGPE